MNRRNSILNIAVALVLVPGIVPAATNILDADFEGKTPGVVIGTGGAAVGEPVLVQNISAYPATNCYGSQCLAIVDNSTNMDATVRFDHEIGGGFNEGTVVVQFDYATSGPTPPGFRLRDGTGSVVMGVNFLTAGQVQVTDAAPSRFVAPWTDLVQVPIQIVLYYPTHLYDLYIDNNLVVPNGTLVTAGDGLEYLEFVDLDVVVTGYALVDNINIFDLDDVATGVPGGTSPLSMIAAPNPFRVETAIRFTTPSSGTASLSIYDVAGRLVRTLAQGSRPGGNHVVNWDGRDANGRSVSAGVYFSRVETEERMETKRITLVR